VTRVVLSVRNLSVQRVQPGQHAVVDRISFDLEEGEVLALVGESGCGKTKTAEAIMGLLPRDHWSVKADSVRLGDSDLVKLDPKGLRRVRGREISMIFQEPLTALDPVFTVGSQLSSVYRRHRGMTRQEAYSSSSEMLEKVGFADAGEVMYRFPHEISGGMRQRIMIAMAMACRPRVLIADEPSTALDVTTQAQVLDQLVRLGQEFGTSILLITHDLGVVAQYCTRAMIMQDGRIIEEASIPDLFNRPSHEHTKRLLSFVSEGQPA